MSYLDPVINPTEDELNAWLSTQTLRGNTNSRRLSDLLNQEQLAAMQADNAMGGDPGVQFAAPQEQRLNTIRSSSGRTIDLGYAAPGGSGVAPDGRRVKSDPWVDGPRVLSRKQLADGTIEVIKEAPALDGFGRQSSKIVREIETPDYLNPAKMKQLEYQTKQAELQKKQNDARPQLANIPKLKPGERWNPEQQRVESVQGSSEYIKQSGTHSKDYAALKSTEQKMDFAIDRVNELLDPKNKDMIERNFGGYNAYATQFLPGAGLQGRNKIEALKSTLKNAGLEMMRTGGSIGQMTEREWPIVEKMIANISPSVSEDDAILELGKISQFMKNIKDNANEIYKTEWGNTQFHKETAPSSAPTEKPRANLSAQDMQAMDWAMKNRGDPRAQKIMQKLGVQ